MARDNQRQRTRKDLLDAAARLVAEGATPGFDEVAAAARVSRATVYRYFPGIDALLTEAALHVAMPGPDLFDANAPSDLVERLTLADGAVAAMMARTEPALRAMLASAVQQGGGEAGPARQNRRSPLIDAAIAGAGERFPAPVATMLSNALALVIGTEAMIVFKDVLELEDGDAEAVRRWMIRALVRAARDDAAGTVG
ncbi:TetR family transcriptional regulator [Sphingomonas suaedae]|uniref:TetR family transcriptional regulator n=1 Tax=Sphingomonas suaedae TaxID=2599297 RepID=A0A518RK19_9SPHN|nr:TetR family transcriptional regulator [Sphingomonas suaedae]QDX27759.1 TetR family transcriptional regulator [Sphingomonas suaedae]